MTKAPDEQRDEFLRQSNLIEQEPSERAFEDAVAAWDWAKGLRELTVDDVRQVHWFLMNRLNPGIAGALRTQPVWVGSSTTPDPALVPEMLRNWVEDVNALLHDDVQLKEETAKMMHVRFEKIHPFEDGNGRTGRILYNWHRLALGLPLHVIHVGDEQEEYYTWFTRGL